VDEGVERVRAAGVRRTVCPVAFDRPASMRK
jgi:hypothetical protein